MSVTLHTGDCLDVMRGMDADSVDAVVTDPPYGLAFMGKRWDYDVPGVETWRQVLRLLKPGGHLLSFAGTRTQHRMCVNIEDAGFEIRDMIAWVYGTGFPKSHNLDGDWQGWGTALKPALEPITLARKPFKGTVAANVLEHGTGGLNVDGCRVEVDPEDAKAMERCNTPGSSIWKGGAFNGDIYGNPGTATPKKLDTTQGRWPANLIHSGDAEVLALFPETKSGKMQPTHTTAEMAVFGQNAAGGYVTSETYGDSGSAARFFYCAKASKRDRDEGLDSGQRNIHATVKPTALMRYLCRLVTPPGGVVLDPFMGSGSTGKAAVLEGFSFVGIEQDPEYVAIARARIDAPRQTEMAVNA
jgi:site-specific DNA-methyltransferase (adenine-specific)